MQCLKGIILDKWLGLMQIELLSTGQKFWVKASPKSRIQRPVLIAWDYIRNEPHDVYTKEDWNIIQGNHKTEFEDFSFPSFGEVGEGDTVDFAADTSHLPIDIWWVEEGAEIGDGVDGDFSNPSFDGAEAGVAEDHHNNH